MHARRADTATGGRWLRTWCNDVAPGDLVRLDGSAVHRVVTRDYTPVTSPLFTVRLDDDSRRTLGKLSRVEIFDSDGAVAARVRTIIDWKSV